MTRSDISHMVDMTHAEALVILRKTLAMKRRMFDYWKTTKRKITPAERAMTLASLQQEIDALEVVTDEGRNVSWLPKTTS